MKIGIDARFLTHPQPGGFKTYTENLIAALADVDSENEYILYLDRPPAPNDPIPCASNFRSRVVLGSMPLVGVPWREQVTLALQAKRDRIDLFHAPCLTAPLVLPCPLVVTVHDLIWATPENFTSNKSWSVRRRLIDWYDYLIPKYAVRRASLIITVSNASKKAIVERLGVPYQKIAVTYEAAGTIFRRIDDPVRLETVRKKYNLPPSFLLAIGTADPRKNIKSLIQAYRMLPERLMEKYKLVIVWTHPFLTHEISRQVNELGLTKNVRFLRQVPTEDLVFLYNNAALFLFASRSEGFGLPLLEAMSCGVPVIAADNSSMPEIAGDAAVYVNAHDVQTIKDAMVRTLVDEELRSQLIVRGFERAGMFSWERCAQMTVDLYRRVIRSQSSG